MGEESQPGRSLPAPLEGVNWPPVLVIGAIITTITMQTTQAPLQLRFRGAPPCHQMPTYHLRGFPFENVCKASYELGMICFIYMAQLWISLWLDCMLKLKNFLHQLASFFSYWSSDFHTSTCVESPGILLKGGCSFRGSRVGPETLRVSQAPIWHHHCPSVDRILFESRDVQGREESSCSAGC